MRGWRVHLNACFREPFSKQLYYLVEMSSGFLIFNIKSLFVITPTDYI